MSETDYCLLLCVCDETLTGITARRLAIALGCQPSQTVHITDQEPMLALMRQNISLNLLEDRVNASILDWGSSSTSCQQLHHHIVPGSSSAFASTPQPTSALGKVFPDVLLAADCVYFEPAFPLLRETLRELVGPNTTCYFCFKKRRRADAHFMTKVKKQFDVQEVTDDPDRDAYARENIFLYTIRARR